MIDWTLGLNLDHKEISIIQAAYKTMSDWEQSLNQTVAYVKDVPMFLDVEGAKQKAAVTPEVQLAVWAGALYQKKIYHRWDRSIPMPGVVVNAHQWALYLFFEWSHIALVSTSKSPLQNTGADYLPADNDGPN